MSRTGLSGSGRFAAAVLAALALAGCGSHATSPQGASSRPPLESIFEAEGPLHADPLGTLDLLKRLGANRVKVFIPWNTVAPSPASTTAPRGFSATDPAGYPASGWSLYDRIVRAAAASAVALDLTIGGPPPLWAAGPGAPGGLHPQWRPSATDFGAFMQAVGTRYSGHYTPPGASAPLPRVSFWSIWNEPNYGPYLAPQAIDNSTVEVSPALYRGLVDAAWNALRQTGHGADTILIGELAPRGITVGNSPGNFSGMVPLRFLRALYCVDSSYHQLRGAAASQRGCPTTAAGSAAFAGNNPGLFHASGFAIHPYPQALAPNVPTPDEPDYADLPQLPKLERMLDQLQRLYGSGTRFSIYSTEFGYKTDPPLPLAPSPATAAYYLNWAEYISWRDPRVRSYDQYQLADPRGGNFPTGLEFANGTPKPSYSAYQLPLYLPVTTGSRGHALEIWGCVRPARYARQQTGKPQLAEIEFAPGQGAQFRAIRTLTVSDPYGYFDVRQALPGSGVIRLGWTNPQGQAVFSRMVSVTIR